MTTLQRWLFALLLLLTTSASIDVRALAQAAPAVAAAPTAEAPRARRGWWTDQRWRYETDAAAESAYRALAAADTPSPWPVWHQTNAVMLPVGVRFQMALGTGQPTDRPGGFGTFERIPNVAFVRRALAVKVAWKPSIDRVVTYEVTAPLAADVGTVGPQIDVPVDRYLPGGASQLQMTVPAAERMQHLRVVEVRSIR